MVDNPRLLSLFEQVRLIRKGEITSSELVQSHLDRISELNPQLNSFIAVDSEGALRHVLLSWSEWVRHRNLVAFGQDRDPTHVFFIQSAAIRYGGRRLCCASLVSWGCSALLTAIRRTIRARPLQ